MQYLKAQEAISVLELLLSLSESLCMEEGGSTSLPFSPSLSLSLPPFFSPLSEELKGAVEKSVTDKAQLACCLSTLSTLHLTYLSPSSPSHIPLIPDPAPSLEAILSPSLSPAQQWAGLQDTRLIQQLYLQVYQLLEETYYPQYCQSEQVGPIPIPSYSYSAEPTLCSSIPSTWCCRLTA